MGTAFSLLHPPTAARTAFSNASVLLMATAMAAMGLQIQLQAIRRAGAKVVYAGLLGFLGLATLAFLLIRALGVS